ncbi:MAG TPA: phosphatase PAP2 family protein [Steroidobacteraceae bacterium]|nr:phosphatase PAP2 family protein [Steroidobacteraceae bacterium]
MNRDPALYSTRAFWRSHAFVPLLGFLVTFGLVEALGLDQRIAGALYFDHATTHWLGTGPGDWWAHQLLHDDGRWLIRGIAAAAIATWVASFFLEPLRASRRRTGYVALAMVGAIVLVGALKSVTNVDCPWDLAGYGGHNPYVPLFADRPNYLPRARCFPGAHASSGFALMCFYFAWRDVAPVRARGALAIALVIGIAFAVGQEARGAHFLSHDLAAAAIVWFVQLSLYRWLLAPAASEVKAGETVGGHARSEAANDVP